MNYIMQKLFGIGSLMAIAGALSIVFSFIGYNLRLLLWIDYWGTSMGWVIRIGLIVAGLLFMLIGYKFNPKSKETTEVTEK